MSASSSGTELNNQEIIKTRRGGVFLFSLTEERADTRGGHKCTRKIRRETAGLPSLCESTIAMTIFVIVSLYKVVEGYPFCEPDA